MDTSNSKGNRQASLDREIALGRKADRFMLAQEDWVELLARGWKELSAGPVQVEYLHGYLDLHDFPTWARTRSCQGWGRCNLDPDFKADLCASERTRYAEVCPLPLEPQYEDAPRCSGDRAGAVWIAHTNELVLTQKGQFQTFFTRYKGITKGYGRDLQSFSTLYVRTRLVEFKDLPLTSVVGRSLSSIDSTSRGVVYSPVGGAIMDSLEYLFKRTRRELACRLENFSVPIASLQSLSERLSGPVDAALYDH